VSLTLVASAFRRKRWVRSGGFGLHRSNRAASTVRTADAVRLQSTSRGEHVIAVPSNMPLISRRAAMIGAAAAAAGLAGRRIDAMPTATQPATAVAFPVPAGACDCHTHVFGDPRQFPMAPARTYTPEPASVAELIQLHRALHIARVVIVQPSVYGADNACTLQAMRQLGARARGVAVIDEHTTEASLDAMHRAGIRGVRVNLATVGQTDPAIGRRRLRTAIDRVRTRGWHIQVYTQLSVIAALAADVREAGVPVVFDHFGGAQGVDGTGPPGFEALVDLVASGHAYVKLSAPYRSSTQAPDYPDLGMLARVLIAANPRRILWGTDWPHPDSSPPPGRQPGEVTKLLAIDDGRVLNELAAWAPDPSERKLILVDNPARLYGF
jgi:predicted TIM-barrel fold metal-dependent hydrolase